MFVQKWSKGKMKEKVNNQVLFDKVSSGKECKYAHDARLDARSNNQHEACSAPRRGVGTEHEVDICLSCRAHTRSCRQRCLSTR